MRFQAAAIVLAGVLAYAQGFSGPFLFDDGPAIVTNASIRQLSPIEVPLSPPANTSVAGRPLANLTLAANYAMGGLDVTSYRVTNLGLHLLVALALFAIVRRSLGERVVPAALREHGDGLALAASLLWALHPLNTEVVNYLVQRTESMMALCYLLTLYCAIRAHERPTAWAWRAAAVVACAAGMASKESMVTAPVMVVLYDRIFFYASLRDALRARGILYAGLALTWILLAVLLLGHPRAAVGFGAGVSWSTYFLDQLPMIARYLWLSIWPRALVLDYGPAPMVALRDVALPGALVAALGVLTVAALRARPLLGFLGAWFFVTLAPASSVVPIATEVGAERRMYLPLMALAVLAVAGGYSLLRTRLAARRGAAVTAVVCVLLAAGTVLRTREYQNVRVMAQTVVDRYPHGRARLALANELVAANEHVAAVGELELATRDYAPAHLALATEMAVSGRLDDAVREAQEFIRLEPNDAEVPTARDLIGRSLGLQGKYEAAAEQFTLLAAARPNDPAPFVSMGEVRLRQRRVDESIASYETALRMRPGDPEILGQLGLAFGAAGRMHDASLAFESAAAARPTDVRFLNLWGRALAAEGRYADALVPMREIARLAPSDNQAADNLAIMERLAARQAAGSPQAGAARPSVNR